MKRRSVLGLATGLTAAGFSGGLIAPAHALQNRIQAVHLPSGTYRTTDTLHLGHGDSYVTIALLGVASASLGGGTAGATIQIAVDEAQRSIKLDQNATVSARFILSPVLLSG